LAFRRPLRVRKESSNWREFGLNAGSFIPKTHDVHPHVGRGGFLQSKLFCSRRLISGLRPGSSGGERSPAGDGKMRGRRLRAVGVLPSGLIRPDRASGTGHGPGGRPSRAGRSGRPRPCGSGGDRSGPERSVLGGGRRPFRSGAFLGGGRGGVPWGRRHAGPARRSRIRPVRGETGPQCARRGEPRATARLSAAPPVPWFGEAGPMSAPRAGSSKRSGLFGRPWLKWANLRTVREPPGP
jgi:hypothetical protein